MERIKAIQQIFKRLSSLEETRETLRLSQAYEDASSTLNDIDEEMTSLREQLKILMNSISSAKASN
jgi:hypothetical protein